MKKLNVDFDEVQKAMEDTARDAFDYIETGEVLILSADILDRARLTLSSDIDEDMENYEEVEFDRDIEIPDWMEDEVELALEILLDEGRYARIPERSTNHAYTAMEEFTNNLEDVGLKKELRQVLDGQGAFRRFKTALDPHPKLRKLWYGYNAKTARLEIAEWLKSLHIEAFS
jgi:hypothetical protein